MREETTYQSKQSRYKQLKVSVNPSLVSAFKTTCAASQVSMATVLTKLMADYCNTAVSRKPSPDYTTRRRRREAVQAIVRQLEQIKTCEEEYRDRIPENLQGSSVYERADELVSLLEEAIDLLSSV